MSTNKEEEKEKEGHSLWHDPEDDWSCGSLLIDRRCITYFVQTFLTLCVMIFAMIMLATRRSEESSVVWITILSTIAGNAMPTASLPVNNYPRLKPK